MAYTNFQNCTANEYKNIVYNQETYNKIKILFNNVELEDADEYCESFEVVSRVIPNGSKIFMLENLVSQEATLILHNIDTSIIQDQVSISIGTLVSENTYEYVPIGIYNLQEIPTTDNGKTTIKLRDNSVKLDFNYNAKPLIDEHGGTATKLQILQDICTKAGITCNVSSFIGSSDLIGIYDNTITGRQYVSYLAGSAGAIPIITRSGALDFKYLNNLSIIQIPIEIVEQYSNAENFKISRVVYEDAIRKYESGNENYDTLFLDSANPYISSQSQVNSIYNIVNNFEINSFKTGRILGNPAIDSYDLIQITDYDGTIFKTFANNTLRYNGKMINTFASEISFERKKENVSLKSGAAFKKWAKTEIDNANAQITIQAGQIEDIEQDLQNPTSIKEGEYFDLEDALDSPLIDFSLYGETQQDSTTGKNLFNKNGSIQNNKYYDGSGNLANNNGDFASEDYISVSSGYYILSCSTNSTLRICTYDTNKTFIRRVYGVSVRSQSINITNDEKYVRISGVLNDINTYQFEKGSTATSWEKYTGGSPAPSPSYPFDIHNVSGDNTIEICGKNLFDIPNGTGTRGNNTFTVNNQQITLNSATSGTESAFYLNDVSQVSRYASSSYSNARDYNMTTTGGTYTLTTYFSAKPSSVFQIYLFTNKKAIMKRTDNSSHWEDGKLVFNIILDDDEYIKSAQAYMNSSNVFDNLIITAQLENNSQATNYEEYKGQSQLISLGVENLFDKTTATQGKGVNKNTGALYNDSGQFATDYIEITPNTNYVTNSYSSSSNYLYGAYYDSSKTYLGAIDPSVNVKTFIITNTNAKYIRLAGLLVNIDTFQLEKGTKANSYSPYGASYIELNKISTYQDYIYKDNDRWFLHKEIGKKILDGSESWQQLAESTWGANGYYIAKPTDAMNWCRLFANYFKDANISSVRILTNGEMAITASSLVLRNNDTTSTNSLQTWLSTHNTIVYYALATPTDTEITDTTLLEQLNNLMTLPLYKNLTHITLTPNDLQPTMKIEYFRDTSINENFVSKEDMTKYYTKKETDAQILINSSSIQQSVSELQETTNGNTGAITSLSNQVNTLQTSTSLQINAINEQLEDGVSKVKTTTGYTLDGNGLSITKGQGFSSLTTDRYQKIEYNNKELSFMGYDDTLNKPISRIEELEARKITTGVHRTETIQEDGEKWTAQYYVGGGN